MSPIDGATEKGHGKQRQHIYRDMRTSNVFTKLQKERGIRGHERVGESEVGAAVRSWIMALNARLSS